MRTVEEILASSPFRTSRLPPTLLQQQLALFLESFQTAVETEDPAEESWAYEKLKGAFSRMTGDPPPSAIDPRMPEGLWEAMKWAAELRVARARRPRPGTTGI